MWHSAGGRYFELQEHDSTQFVPAFDFADEFCAQLAPTPPDRAPNASLTVAALSEAASEQNATAEFEACVAQQRRDEALAVAQPRWLWQYHFRKAYVRRSVAESLGSNVVAMPLFAAASLVGELIVPGTDTSKAQTLPSTLSASARRCGPPSPRCTPCTAQTTARRTSTLTTLAVWPRRPLGTRPP